MMQPQAMPEQPLSVPRRALDVEDYVDILRRHRSWILGPTFIGLVAGVVTAFLWPNSYMASGLIRVVPPQVPSRLVQSNVTEEMTQRINAIYQNIVSRQSLLNLIQTYNLYPEDRKRLPTEDVIEQMRREITMGQMEYLSRGAGALRQNMSAFRVGFSYSDRRLAQKVCVDLISRFIDESVKSRSTQSIMTTEFFKDQYEVAKRDLAEVDQRITAFRMRSPGELPEQEQVMFGRITAAEANIQAVSGQLSRAQQDRLQLETQLRVLRDQALQAAQAAPEQAGAGAAAKNERLADVDREIEGAQNALARMRESWKDSHPDVQKTLSYLQSLQKRREQVLREIESAKADTPMRTRQAVPQTTSRAAGELQGNIARLQSALQAKDMEIDDLNKQLSETRAKLKTMQARLESTPAAHQEFVQLMREREMANARYEELAKKMQDSSMATDLESRKQGELLEILETPAIPEEPYAPKRPLIIVLGLIFGAGAGVALAGGREIKDTSLKNLKDVRAYTKLTVLGSIPLLENDFVVKRRRRLGWLAWTATFMMGMLLMGGSIVYYYTSKG